jgi:hypothetical protein
VEHLSGTEGGDERTVVVREDDTASTSLGGGGLVLVGGDDTLLGVNLGEGLGEVIVTDRADVGNRLGGKDVLKLVGERGGGEKQMVLSHQAISVLTAAPRAAFWAAPPAT